jgi:hypothetical protein
MKQFNAIVTHFRKPLEGLFLEPVSPLLLIIICHAFKRVSIFLGNSHQQGLNPETGVAVRAQ